MPAPAETYQDSWVGAKTVKWIEQYREEQPFFLQVGFPGPHSPFDAPAEYVERYRDADVQAGSFNPPELPDHEQGREFFAARLSLSSADTVTEEQVRELRRYYYANVTLIDEYVGASSRRWNAGASWSARGSSAPPITARCWGTIACSRRSRSTSPRPGCRCSCGRRAASAAGWSRDSSSRSPGGDDASERRRTGRSRE